METTTMPNSAPPQSDQSSQSEVVFDFTKVKKQVDNLFQIGKPLLTPAALVLRIQEVLSAPPAISSKAKK